MADDLDKQRSTTSYVFTFVGAAINLISRLQQVVALSTTEAEYVALTKGAKEMIWLQHLLGESGCKQEVFALFCDSNRAIHLAKNVAFHSQTKHIELRYHFTQSVLEEGILKVENIHTKVNPTNALTKIISREKLEFCRASLGIVKM